MATPEQRKKERAERKARWKQVQENGAGAAGWQPKEWERAPRKYPSVMPLDLPDSMVQIFTSSLRKLRG